MEHNNFELSEKAAMVLNHLTLTRWQPELHVYFDRIWIEKTSKCEKYRKYQGITRKKFVNNQFDLNRNAHDKRTVDLYPREYSFGRKGNDISDTSIDLNCSSKQQDSGRPLQIDQCASSTFQVSRQPIPHIGIDTADEIIFASQQQVKRMVGARGRNGKYYSPHTYDPSTSKNILSEASSEESKKVSPVLINEMREEDSTIKSPLRIQNIDEPIFSLMSPAMMEFSPKSSLATPDCNEKIDKSDDFSQTDATQTTISSEIEHLVDVIPSPERSFSLKETKELMGPPKIPIKKRNVRITRRINDICNELKRNQILQNTSGEHSTRSGPEPSDQCSKNKDNVNKHDLTAADQYRIETSKLITSDNDRDMIACSVTDQAESTGIVKNSEGGTSNRFNERYDRTIVSTNERSKLEELVDSDDGNESRALSQVSTGKKRRFVPPLKSATNRSHTSSSDRVKRNNTDRSDHGVSTELDISQVSVVLADAGLTSIQLCLEYSDGSSSLRPTAFAPHSRHRPQPTIAVVACSFSGGVHHDSYIRLPVESPQSAELLTKILGNASHRICFDSQQVMLFALQRCEAALTEAINRWRINDPSVAVWLLHPDNPPSSFVDILRFLDLPASRHANLSRQHQLLADLKLLRDVDRQLQMRLRQNQLMAVYEHLEVPLTPLLVGMQYVGMSVDTAQMHLSAAECRRRLRWLESTAHQQAGSKFQLTSTVQLRRILFDQLQLHQNVPKNSVKITSTGVRSTCESVLRCLSSVHPLPALLLEHRRVQKLMSTYVDGLLSHVHNGAIYPQWQQTAAATGRVQAASPNIQSVPKLPLHLAVCSPPHPSQSQQQQTQIAKTIAARAAFVARAGCCFLSADFQQMELRLLAHLSGNRQLIDTINSADATPNSDIFRQLSAQWSNTESHCVTQEQRERTKRVVYSAMYGVGAASLADSLHCDQDEAQRLISSFLKWCPAVEKFSRDSVELCQRSDGGDSGCVTTLVGRKRWIGQIHSSNHQERMQAARQAVNFRVQGSAADVCKLISIAVAEKRPTVPLLAQLHDELLWEVPEQHIHEFALLVDQTAAQLTHLLRQCGVRHGLSVSLPVSISVGDNWSAMSKYSLHN